MDELNLTIRTRLTPEQKEYVEKISALIFKAAEQVEAIEVHLLEDLTIGLRLTILVSRHNREYLWINEIDFISEDFPLYLFEDTIDEAKEFINVYNAKYKEYQSSQYMATAWKNAELIIEICENIKKELEEAIQNKSLERRHTVENIFDYILVSRDQRFSH